MAITLYLGKCAGPSLQPAFPWLSCRAGIDSGQGLGSRSTRSIAPAFSCVLVLYSYLSHLDSVSGESTWLEAFL